MELLIYLLKVSACLALFFSFYLLVLRRLTFFKINRFYLLGSLVFSFAIPAMQFTIEQEISFNQKEFTNRTLVTAQSDYLIEKSNPIHTTAFPVVKETAYNWIALIYYGYGLVALAMVLVCIFQIVRLIKYTRDYTSEFNGLKLISKTKGFTNCSFFNYVFIDETKLSETDLQVLLKHEQIHSKQFHSIDKILLMIAKAILWFNPIIYLFDDALEQTHEYEADEATSESFGNHAYAGLLLRLAVNKSEMPLIHNFVKSPIKERVRMLFCKKSNGIKKTIYLFALPIGLALLWLFSVQIVYAEVRHLTDLGFKNKRPIIARNKIKEEEKTVLTSGFKKQKIFSFQKVDTTKSIKLIIPKIISSSKIIGNVKSKSVYLEDAVIEIQGDKLKAKSVEWDRVNNLLTAYKAENFNGSYGVISEKIVFDLKAGTYKTFDSSDDRSRKSFGNYNIRQNDLVNEGF
ncbi:M56 family metallopeptidase [Pedobacter jamesrossensis]|uniref:M56 family metallopeptidase n=1 Tax=Pedobacter jamesrossensis TaxID=1908238 RepID=A0ABV8NDT0_9SPHI